ncbi:MAG: hypothetical protein ACRDJG_09620 [Actinomycetota bacterium]
MLPPLAVAAGPDPTGSPTKPRAPSSKGARAATPAHVVIERGKVVTGIE